MNWFTKLLPSKIKSSREERRSIPEGIWNQCPSCQACLFAAELERNLNVCPQCDHHLRLSARARLEHFFDHASWSELDAKLEPVDWLKFKDTKKYKDRLHQAQKTTGEKDALITMSGKLQGQELVAAAFEFDFIGGSMGAVVGEKFVRAVTHCLQHQLPFVCFASSGGARMQESLIALMQMARTSAALAQLAAAGLPYIVVLTDPCTGGVSASLAMLGDVNIAEPKALIGFAGRRVIESTVREVLPEDFQTSEFLLAKGFIDMIVDRRELRDQIALLLAKFMATAA